MSGMNLDTMTAKDRFWTLEDDGVCECEYLGKSQYDEPHGRLIETGEVRRLWQNNIFATREEAVRESIERLTRRQCEKINEANRLGQLIIKVRSTASEPEDPEDDIPEEHGDPVAATPLEDVPMVTA